MAFSLIPSSSSNTCQFKYDVFLSFRGEDTRSKFTSHLHKALLDKQIETFIDYKLNSGDEISPSLLKAIEESHISVIIFSQDYASSRWCLEELVKILECRRNRQQIVIPVFYEIDPSHVRHQSGSFEVAFAKHALKMVGLDTVKRWKDALKKAANISGFDSHVYKNECELIEAIVHDVLKRLKDHLPSSLYGKCRVEESAQDKKYWGCRKCGERELSVLVLPCRHLCLCTVCGSNLHGCCPVCHSLIAATLQIYLS